MTSFVGAGSADATTTEPRATELAAFVAGVACGEGSFGDSTTRFAFVVALGAEDIATCHLLKAFLGVGTVRVYARRQAHYDDEAIFRVQRLRDLVEVIVPFMDEHLAPSFKRKQYEPWRAALLDYWEYGAKRRRPCSLDGCEELARAKRLCRHHYYATFGR